MATDTVTEEQTTGDEGENLPATIDRSTPHDRAVERARMIGAALQETAAAIPIRQIKYELWERGQEWLNAAEELENVGDDGTIDLLCSVTPGMKVPSNSRDDSPFVKIIRIMSNGGQHSLHVRIIRDGRTIDDYRNMIGPSSPVVTRR